VGWALVRGGLAYLALFATLVLLAPVPFFFFADTTTCPDGGCSIGDYTTQGLALAAVVAFTFLLASQVFFIPFMILFVVLTYLKAMNGTLWAVIGAVVAIWFGLRQRAFGTGINQGGGWPELAALVASPPGLALALVGAVCGWAVWAMDRRLKAM